MGLEEPLLVNEACQPQYATNVRHGDRAVLVDASPVVKHRARVVNHRRPADLPAQQYHRPRKERGQPINGSANGARAARRGLHHVGVNSSQALAVVQRPGAPIGDHHVARHAEGSLNLVVAQTLQRAGLAAPQQPLLDFGVAVELGAQRPGEAHGGQEVHEVDKRLEGCADERLHGHRVPGGQEAGALDLPQRHSNHILFVLEVGAASQRGATLPVLHNAGSLRRGAAVAEHHARALLRRPVLERAHMQPAQLLPCHRRMAYGLERLRGVTAGKGQEEELSAGMILQPWRHGIDLAIDNDPSIIKMVMLNHLGPS
mmetsp:Transcript_116163/g.335475  ORF Transcript_116163/g.335475 Transcript_116163/m.335475 type:complete len:315 (+) Transcript_116163:646-1590(+)